MISFVFLNGKRTLDRWNQEELLQTPKNREAHNIPNICHTTYASRVNACACRHEHGGPEPFAATLPWNLAAEAVPRWPLLLPSKASSRGEYVSLPIVLPLLISGHRRKASKSRIVNLNVIRERQDICYLLLLFPFGLSGWWFLTSSPCGKAKTTLFLHKVYMQA